MDAASAATFALLGIAPGPDIGLSAAASLTGLPAAMTKVALRGLEQASLINQDARGRYRMPDLIRRYAGEIAHHLADSAPPLGDFRIGANRHEV